MSKKLKDFVEENRRAFDDELPPVSTWEAIEQSIARKHPGTRLRKMTLLKWSAAAAVFFIAITAAYFLFVKSPAITKSNLAEKTETQKATDVNIMSPEFAATARKISASIDERQELLKELAADTPGLYDQFSSDLGALDSAYRVLRTQAQRAPNREIILRAMIQNLQLQAELLAKQLQVIDNYKNNKTESHETNSLKPL